MSKKNKSKGDSSASPSPATFLTVLFYCLLIIFLPIVCFFGSKWYIFDQYLELSQVTGNIYSAVVAVVALHVALFFYIYRAYFETESRPVRQGKED